MLVSQDRHEIYLTFANYNPQYVEYLQHNNTTPQAFLVMESYGPWLIDDYDDMRSLGQVTVALALLASEAA